MDHVQLAKGLLLADPWTIPPDPQQAPDQAAEYNQQVTRFCTDLCNLHNQNPNQLLQILIRIQYRFGWVPYAAQSILSNDLKIAIGEIRAVIAFYSFLSSEFQGRYRILLSSNITDYMLGLDNVITACQTHLKLSPGTVREDFKCSLELTSCTGLCDQGPAGLINGYPIKHLDEHRICELAQLVDAGTPFNQWPEEWFEID
ncbi:MAG: NAD(P)H-dependent oxidoreductase subunit E [Motiliproteus sp.]|nr:NAD(P)H-dependent oxidoreductase subunit E [Motiliproteus sp.]